MHSSLHLTLNTTKWMLLSRFYIDHTHPQVKGGASGGD